MPFDPSQFTTRDPLASLYTAEFLASLLTEMGPPLPPPTRWQRLRNRARHTSLRAREWIAVKVLRLNLGGDE